MHIGRQGSVGDPPRSAYHHGNLRAALIDAGLELTRVGGPTALGLRDATRRVGVSPNAAYRHFADRQALLAAVADAILRRVATTMAEHRPTGDPLDDTARTAAAVAALRAVGLGYIDFALREPGWFEVAFGALEMPPDGRWAPPFVALVGALDELVAVGALSRSSRAGAEWPCWSTVHGFALLALHGPLRAMHADERWRAAERTVDTVIVGLLAGQPT